MELLEHNNVLELLATNFFMGERGWGNLFE